MTALLAPRRLLVAVAIALLMGGGTVLATGYDAVSSDLPASFGVAEPRAGDRGNYSYAFIGDDGAQVGPDVGYLDFERALPGTVLDATGQPLEVQRLTTWAWDYGRELMSLDNGWRWGPHEAMTLATDAAGGMPLVELSFEEQQTQEGFGTEAAGMPVYLVRNDGNLSFLIRVYNEQAEPTRAGLPLHEGFAFCGARNGLQAVEVRLDGPVELFSPCLLRTGGVDPTRLELANGEHADEVNAIRDTAPAVFVEPGAMWKPLGTQVLDGRETVVFRLIDRSAAQLDGPEEGRNVRAWFTRGIPYPVQVAVSVDAGTHLLRLTNFVAGSQPLAFDGAEALAAPPALVQGPAHPWGMEDGGLATHVSAAGAWQAALDEGTLAAFLDAHPDAVVVSAATSTFRNVYDGSEQGDSQFIVSDATSAYAFGVEASYKPLVAAPPVLGLPIPEVEGETTYTLVEPSGLSSAPYPLGGSPSQMPTAASLFARMAGFTAQDGPVGAWGHSYTCEAPRETEAGIEVCDDAALVLAIGTLGTTLAPNLSDPAAPGLDLGASIGTATFRPDGDVTALMVLGGQARSTVAPAQAIAPASEVPYEPPQQAGEDWEVPPVQVMAAASLLGILAAAGYLLWPLAKGGAVGLYARVTGPAVLEHPQRQRLLAAVEARPGIHLKELSRATGLAWGQTQHHVAKLVSAGILVAKPTAGYTCYFPKGQDRHVMGAAAVLKADGARRLLEAATRSVGLSVGQLARAAGLTESTAHYHLKRLEAAGLLATHLVGGVRQVTVTPLGGNAASVYGGAPAAAA